MPKHFICRAPNISKFYNKYLKPTKFMWWCVKLFLGYGIYHWLLPACLMFIFCRKIYKNDLKQANLAQFYSKITYFSHSFEVRKQKEHEKIEKFAKFCKNLRKLCVVKTGKTPETPKIILHLFDKQLLYLSKNTSSLFWLPSKD